MTTYIKVVLLVVTVTGSVLCGTADWHVLNRSDTLALFIKEMRVGEVVHRTVVDDRLQTITDRTAVHATNTQGTGNDDSLVMSETRIYGFDGKLKEASQDLRSAMGTTAWNLTGTTDGWLLKVVTGNGTTTRPVKSVPDRLDNVRALYSGIMNRALKPGTVWTDTVTDLTSGSLIVSATRVVAQPRSGADSVWRLEIHDSMTRSNAQWILDKTGATVLQEMPPFTARRSAGNRGDRENETTPRFSITELLSVPATREPGSRDRIKLVLETPDMLDTSVRRMYQFKNNTWVLNPQITECAVETITPVNGQWVRPTVTMQSDNASIKKLAAEIASGKIDRCSVIGTLNAYVFSRLKKRNTAAFSNAVETLNAGYGDCGEHAVLLGALLRSRGIAARVMLGLVYVPATRTFGYHAWVAVAQNGGWVYADPAFGQFPAVHTLIPLIFDDTGENAVFMAGLIGKIGINVE